MPSFPTSARWNASFQRFYPPVAFGATVVPASEESGSDAPAGATRMRSGTVLQVPSSFAGSDTRARSVPVGAAITLYLKLIVLPLAIAFVMLAWPVGLGSAEDRRITPLSFAVFQGLYTLIGLPLMLLLFHYTIPGMPLRAVAVLTVVGQLLIQGFFVLMRDVLTSGALPLARALGPVFYAVLIIAFYTAHAVRAGTVRRPDGGDGNGSSDGGANGSNQYDDFLYVAYDDDGSVHATALNASERDGALDGDAADADISLGVGRNTDSHFRLLQSVAKEEREVLRARAASTLAGSVTGSAAAAAARPGFVNDSISRAPFTATSESTLGGRSSGVSPSFGDHDTDVAASALSDHAAAGCCGGPGSIALHPLGRVAVAFLLLAGLFAAFLFCQWCALVLFAPGTTSPFMPAEDAGAVRSSATAAGRYFFFVGVIEALCFVVKRAGRLADAVNLHGVLDVVSAEFCCEVFMALFFAIFVRALFQQIRGWEEFAIVSAVHFAFTLLIFPARMTKAYFRVTDALQRRYLAPGKPLAAIPGLSLLYDPSNPAQWNTRMALDFMVRFVAATTASLAFLVVTVFLRFGYNREYYDFFAASLSAGEFRQTMLFYGCSALMEVACFALVYVCSRGLVDRGIATPFTLLMWRQPRYVMFAVWSAAHITTDVFLAHIKIAL